MRIVIPILVLLAVVGALAGIKAQQIGLLLETGKAAEEAGPPPEAVGTGQSRKDTWQKTLSSVGSVEAERGVTISNDSPGIVTRLNFDSGDRIKAGTVLVELETHVERAQLNSVLARLDFARTERGRSRTLQEQGVVTASDLDSAESNVKSLEGEAAALRAQIERKVVRAPFGGKLGIRKVNLGQFLGPGSEITTLQSEKEEYVDFSLPQEALGPLRVGLPVKLTVKQSELELDGVVAAIDPDVSQRTRSVQVRASTTDPEKRLRPGMFVNVSVLLDETQEVTTVPVTAAVYATYGDSVFVIEEDTRSSTGKVARQQFVQLGRTRGDFIEVTKGLKAGETVVVAGAFKLRNGAPVKINNDIKLDPKLNPDPPNR